MAMFMTLKLHEKTINAKQSSLPTPSKYSHYARGDDPAMTKSVKKNISSVKKMFIIFSGTERET